MPPKTQQKASKKTEQKQKEKIIEDKTFGLKNKKGAKQQKFIQIVQHNVKNPGQSAAKLAAQKHEEKKKKEMDELADLNKILKPVTQMPKIDNSVDPKSILCVFFKQGMCEKGEKCKFSHDLTIERKSEKKNLYVDAREPGDTMEDWDEEKLAEVVEKKHGESDKAKPKTAIVCKYFLDAVEEAKYGWFWECPNGEKCIYRHALPSGYVLKKDRKKLEEVAKGDEISLEDLIEKERAALGAELTKITYDTFLAWKRRKIQEKKAKFTKEATKKLNEFKAGRINGLSGRDLFTFKTDWADDEEADDTSYHPHEDEEGEIGDAQMEAKEIDINMFRMGDDGEFDEFSDQPGSSNGLPPSMEINEDLFDPDDIPDDFEEDDEDGDDNEANGSENDQNDENAEEMAKKCRIKNHGDDSPEN